MTTQNRSIAKNDVIMVTGYRFLGSDHSSPNAPSLIFDDAAHLSLQDVLSKAETTSVRWQNTDCAVDFAPSGADIIAELSWHKHCPAQTLLTAPNDPHAVSAETGVDIGLKELVRLIHAMHHGVLPANSLLSSPLCPEETVSSGSIIAWHTARDHRRTTVPTTTGAIQLDRYTRPIRSPGPARLLKLSAESTSDIAACADRLLDLANKNTELTHIIAEAQQMCRPGITRAALVAENEEELTAKLAQLSDKIKRGGKKRLNDPKGLWLDSVDAPGKVAILFPGHGAQYPGMLREQECYIPTVRQWLSDFHDSAGAGGILPCPLRPVETGLPKPELQALMALEGGGTASLAGSLGLYDALIQAGVKPDVLCGYSNGENSAMIASGCFAFPSRSAMFDFIAMIAKAGQAGLARDEIPTGATLSVTYLNRETVLSVIQRAGPHIHIATDDSPSHLTLFGPPAEITTLQDRLSTIPGTHCLALPNDRSYHTPAFSPELPSIRETIDKLSLCPTQVPVFSCCTLELFPSDSNQKKPILATQYVETVRFRRAIEHLYDQGVRVFIEAGPKGYLSALARQTLKGRKTVIVEMDRQGRPGWRQTLLSLGRLHVQGIITNLETWHLN